MVEHQSAESEGLRFDSSWELRVFSLSHAREKMKSIFLYFFTKLKTYHPSYSIYKIFSTCHGDQNDSNLEHCSSRPLLPGWINWRNFVHGLKNEENTFWFCFAGMLRATVVLDLSSAESFEVWAQPASHVWSRAATADPWQMWGCFGHRRTSITCTVTKNVWKTGLPVLDTYSVEVGLNKAFFSGVNSGKGSWSQEPPTTPHPPPSRFSVFLLLVWNLIFSHLRWIQGEGLGSRPNSPPP